LKVHKNYLIYQYFMKRKSSNLIWLQPHSGTRVTLFFTIWK
jgi:hypothetical protein